MAMTAKDGDLRERPGNTLKTVDRALSLLEYFQQEPPVWALSELARTAGMDKVTTMRALNSLAVRGFVEQDSETRKYRLGAAFLRFARIRESLVPLAEVLQPVVDRLAVETGETVHASTFNGPVMSTIAIAEPDRATRVTVHYTQPVPVYASSSGLVFLAHAAPDLVEDTLDRLVLERHAQGTPTDLDDIRARLRKAADRGYAVGAQTFEDEVTGIAAPIFDWHGKVCATIAAACVASRMEDSALDRISRAVMRAAAEATEMMGGEPRRHRADNPGEHTA